MQMLATFLLWAWASAVLIRAYLPAMLCYAMLCYAMLCLIRAWRTLRSTSLCYAMLCYAMPHTGALHRRPSSYGHSGAPPCFGQAMHLAWERYPQQPRERTRAVSLVLQRLARRLDLRRRAAENRANTRRQSRLAQVRTAQHSMAWHGIA